MCLIVLAAPTAVLESLKCASLFFFGDGHWATGLTVLLCAYAFSLFVTERMFQMMRPKLMTLPWFKTAWTTFVSGRQKTLQWLHSKWESARNVVSRLRSAQVYRPKAETRIAITTISRHE
jgi:hypothetical protein